jgi:hypothetical protein
MNDHDDLPIPDGPLGDQLRETARAFATDAEPLAAILANLWGDVDRAERETMEIMPVCHHSPSSAIHMRRRLEARPPRVIYLECCEDMRPLVDGLRDCQLPVALQAFAAVAEAFPPAWSPLNLVAPITEFSAEFQAIAFALENPTTTELVFVDRSADHVFQWLPKEDEAVEEAAPPPPDPDDDEAAMHGSALGVEIGSLMPTFDAFRRVLLKNARVQHFSEWWDLFVEEAIIDASPSTYRRVMFLIGSLFRRLGSTGPDRHADELRERFMWTRMKEHLRDSGIDPKDAIHICGAAHAASRVAEFGLESDLLWDVPPRTDTKWLYGLLPSSYGAICHQFGHPRGAVSMAEARWKKALDAARLKPFQLAPIKAKSKARKKADDDPSVEAEEEAKPARKSRKAPAKTASPAPAPVDLDVPLLDILKRPPRPPEDDPDELIGRCVRIVELARRNGYLATTADSIAVYQTSILLSNLRNRRQPSPYDFRDAAVTCLEKDAVPGRRDVAHLCDQLLGGDRIGRIGFESLPPLARDVMQRLEPLPIAIESRTIQRALLDFRRDPGLLPCADLLWKLHYLLPQGIVRPILGQRSLGHVPIQESWDVALGKHQGAVIQLGYEGVSVEHVLERRLKKKAFGVESRTADALEAAEDSLVYLRGERLTEELGERAVDLLVREPDANQAGAILERITRLVHHYRTTESGLPTWARRFVTTGYGHYATLLPASFSDRGVRPDDLASMLAFLFSLESLALSLGCERSQLVIAIKQAGPVTDDPVKRALLWSAECVIGLRTTAELRERLDAVLDNELTLPRLPDYLSGFLLALAFTPMVAALSVELMSRAFAELPDRILMPWLPSLLRMLRPHARTTLPTLVKEAAGLLPTTLAGLDSWRPPWDKTPVDPGSSIPASMAPEREGPSVVTEEVLAARDLLSRFPAAARALGPS